MEKMIDTYIVNLEKRIDRKEHIIKEFKGRSEFNIIILKAIEDDVAAYGLYKSLCKVITLAKQRKLPYILFCEDDHQFSEQYCKEKLEENILTANALSADLLLGGVTWFDYGTRSSSDLFWINNFNGTQFSIIFSKFYDKILESEFQVTDVIDEWLAQLSKKKYLINPIISTQQYFGYSDVTINNDTGIILNELIANTIDRLNKLNSIYSHISKLDNEDFSFYNTWDDTQISTYVINSSPNNIDHIKREFKDKSEFDLQILKNVNDDPYESLLWASLKKAVNLAKRRQEEVILVCTDNHLFTKHYDKSAFFKSIYKAAYLGADILSGGSISVNQTVIVDEQLCWVNCLQSIQFILIFEKFYNEILNNKLLGDESVDLKISNMTANKYLFHPYISEYYQTDNFPILHYDKKYKICSDVLDVIRDNTI